MFLKEVDAGYLLLGYWILEIEYLILDGKISYMMY